MKRTINRFLALMMSVALLCAVFCETASALDRQEAQLSIGTALARPGDTVTVELSLTEVTSIGGIRIRMVYDSEKLECVGATAQGMITQMDMNTPVIEPSGYSSQVWLSGMSLGGVSGSGTILQMQFRVKEDASGFAAVTFADDEQELYDVDIQDVGLTLMTGGVTISENAPAATTAAATTAAESAAPSAQKTTDGGNIVVTDANGNDVTRADGSVVTVLPAITVTQENGTVETKANGEPLTVAGVAVMLGRITVNPGGDATLELSLSEVSELSVLSIRIAYDTSVMAFVDGFCTGFVKDSMNLAKIALADNSTDILLTASNPTPVSGSGVIATLDFQIYSDAPAGEYEVYFSAASQLLTANAASIPCEDIAGGVIVEGDAVATGVTSPASTKNNSGTVWLLLGLIVVAAAVIALGAVMMRRKKGSGENEQTVQTPTMPKTPKPTVPRVTDISGEEDASDEED